MQKIKSFSFFKRTFPYIKKYKKLFILDLIFSIAATMCEIMFPRLLKRTAEIVTDSLEKKIEVPISLIFKNASIFIVLAILEIIGIYYMNYIGHLAGAKIEADMRKDLFSHIQKLNINYFTNTKIGRILSRFTHDLSKITEFIHHLPEQIVISSLKFVFCAILMLKECFSVGVIILIFSPIMFAICRYYNIKLLQSFKNNAIQLGELNSQVEASLLGIHITKSFSNEKFEKEKFQTENKKTYQTKKFLYINLGQFNGIMRFFILLAYFLVATVGLLQISKGRIKATSYLTCFIYADMFLKQVITLLHTLEKYQEGNTPLIRFFEILDTKPTIKNLQLEDTANHKNNYKKEIEGKIEFKNAYFKYEKNANFVIKNLNLTINKGENIALIGLSGSGKTTLCNLIQRFYDLTEGEILIDGVNIKNIPIEKLRKAIGVVEQNVYLFPGTIFQNIQYGNINSTEEEIVLASKNAGLFEFVSSLPDKFETNVGERGIKLSGGQKQRISIARMFLKNPPILILDEATSCLDIKTEGIIKNSLRKLSQNKTTITIAHRPFTTKSADRILILDDGKIKEQGTHTELLKTSEFYRSIYDDNF